MGLLGAFPALPGPLSPPPCNPTYQRKTRRLPSWVLLLLLLLLAKARADIDGSGEDDRQQQWMFPPFLLLVLLGLYACKFVES